MYVFHLYKKQKNPDSLKQKRQKIFLPFLLSIY